MNISLTGMMGSGKTTIGKLLTQKLNGYSFIDTDSEIVIKENKTINEIFANDGEAYFRIVETEILKEVLNKNNQIISTGGGIVISEDNINLLKENSIVFYLAASVDTLFDRVKNNKERPLLNVEDMRIKINELLNKRACQYQKAHYIINTDYKSPDEVTNEILGIINEHC